MGDVNKLATKAVTRLSEASDVLRELADEYHIHPARVNQANRFADRIFHLVEEIGEVYDL